jgi:hypothetical protein
MGEARTVHLENARLAVPFLKLRCTLRQRSVSRRQRCRVR